MTEEPRCIMTAEERLDRLRLARTRGIGPQVFDRLLGRFGSAGAILAEGCRFLPSAPPDSGRVMAEIAAAEELGGRIVVRGEALYPPALAAIADVPVAFTVLGRPELLRATPFAIVGSRNASGNGRRLAEMLARGVADEGMAVVSGLARGIDAAAHRGALEGRGSTIAVLGCGVDIAYPAENAGLLEAISRTGAVVSECTLGAPPHARQFPRRNRIIAGLSWGVLVVEAAERSGSLMTARLALEQGREVMAVPGSPADPRHRGTNRLIKQGAAMIETIEDLRAERPPLSAEFGHPTERDMLPSPQAGARRIGPKRVSVEEKNVAAAKPSRRDAGYQSVAALLGPEPLSVDELIRQCQGNAAEVQDALLDLELDGRLVRHPGNRVSLEEG